jgi:Tol biopolymer transport system component
MKQVILLILFAGMLYDVHAQLPKTKIVLFDLQRSAKGYQLQTPKIISKGKGYNNQPWFTADGENLFFVSSVDTSNTEIYKYRLAKKKLQRITKTKEAEYSARHSPTWRIFRVFG